MPKGGYKIIDMKGINVVGADTMIPGVYEAIESANGKALLFTNFVDNGIEHNSFYAIASALGSSTYNIRYYDGNSGEVRYARISSDDIVVTNVYRPSQTAGEPPETDGPSASM